jgi:glycosyltransferase involved in cell wall biosynthesis
VFAHIARAWPEAPVYTALYDSRACGDLVPADRVHTSFLQNVPLADRYFRALAPLYPVAFERFDLSAFDVVVSSTTAWAKGVRTAPGAVHVCYINTPSRFLVAFEGYLGGFGVPRLARPLMAPLRDWDRRAALRPTAFIANSHNVAERVRAYYGRDAFVLPCPVDVDRFRAAAGTDEGDYFLVLSRLLAYKRVDLAIDAAALAGVRLIVAGEGPALRSLRTRARKLRSAEVVGYVPDSRVAALVAGARAVIVPGEEDFGLVPLEAAAAGTPAIALRRGGAVETVVDGVTGVFFDEQTAPALAGVLRRFDRSRFDRERMRAHAEKFSPERFIARLRALVGEIVEHGEDGARRRIARGESPASGAERA